MARQDSVAKSSIEIFGIDNIHFTPAQKRGQLFLDIDDFELSVGPPGIDLQKPATIRIDGVANGGDLTLAQYRDGKWLALPTSHDLAHGTLLGSTTRLGLFAVMKKSDVDGSADLIPEEFALYQNYPNPFNPTTTIQYDIARTTYVRLSVYDLLGREQVLLVDDMKLPGRYAVSLSAGNLSTGVYFYRLSTPEFSQVRKLLVVK